MTRTRATPRHSLAFLFAFLSPEEFTGDLSWAGLTDLNVLWDSEQSKTSFQVNLPFQVCYLLVMHVLNSNTNTSVCLCMCVYLAAFTYFPYQINWLMDKFYIKTVLEKKRRERKKCFYFPSPTQLITWSPLTFVFIFFSEQKYLFFLLSILEIVFQGMTLMEGRASGLTPWMLPVDWLLLAKMRKKCGMSPFSGNPFIEWEVTPAEEKRTRANSATSSPCDPKTHCVTFLGFNLSVCKIGGKHVMQICVDRLCS